MSRALVPLALAAGVIGAITVAAAPAGATIVVDRSIAGVKLGDSRARVVAVLGTPTRVTARPNEITGAPDIRLRYRRLDVTLNSANVVAVSTIRRAERTAKGIGYGSTLAAVRAAYPAAQCFAAFKGTRVCTLATPANPGARTTQILVRDAKVVRISVGLVID